MAHRLLRHALRSGAFRAARPMAPLLARRTQHFSRAFSTVKLTFVDADGDEETVDAEVGDSLLDVAFEHDIEIEGACGGEIACSTCHVILDEKTYNALPKPEEEEEDMLDLALGLQDTSRLGCQVIVTKEMDGIKIRLPAEVANMQFNFEKPRPVL